MFKPRRIYRREDQKVRMYSALRRLYEQGVRVCAGRRAPAEKPVQTVRPMGTAATRAARNEDKPLSLEIDGASSAFDPYNNGGR